MSHCKCIHYRCAITHYRCAMTNYACTMTHYVCAMTQRAWFAAVTNDDMTDVNPDKHYMTIMMLACCSADQVCL